MAQALRALRAGGLYFDGLSAYAVVQPFTVYGWNEITIAEWIYMCWPKANTAYSKFSMIGEYTSTTPSMFCVTQNSVEYTYAGARFVVVKPDGTIYNYSYNFSVFKNTWLLIVRRFTKEREISYWVNGVKVFASTVPADWKTVLEWDPDRSPRPELYRRFTLAANTGLSERMKMMYGEVRVYNRALTDDEIRAIYERGALIRDGLVLLLDFSEYEGDMAYDKSGCGNHATLYGARWVVKKALYRM